MEFGLELYQRLLAVSVFDILLLFTKLFSNNCGPYLTYFIYFVCLFFSEKVC